MYDLLNSVDHLELYARLKGLPSKDIQSKVETLLRKVDLYDSRYTLSKDLSGGQKRKLSIGNSLKLNFFILNIIMTFFSWTKAIALIGDPKVIF